MTTPAPDDQQRMRAASPVWMNGRDWYSTPTSPTYSRTAPDIVVFHEGTTEAGTDFDLNGEIVQAESAFVLQLSLQEPETRRLRYVELHRSGNPMNLKKPPRPWRAIFSGFCRSGCLNQDLDPWMPRMLSDSTTIAFLKAMTYILTGESGRCGVSL